MTNTAYCRAKVPKDKTYKINRAKLLYLYSLLWSVNFQVEFQQQKYIL